MELATKHASLRSKVGGIVQHTDELLASLRDGAQPAEETDEAASRNIETTLGIFCDSFSSFRSRLEDQDLVVAVLALTKSGKPARRAAYTG